MAEYPMKEGRFLKGERRKEDGKGRKKVKKRG
jgi:hypothetical protein